MTSDSIKKFIQKRCQVKGYSETDVHTCTIREGDNTSCILVCLTDSARILRFNTLEVLAEDIANSPDTVLVMVGHALDRMHQSEATK